MGVVTPHAAKLEPYLSGKVLKEEEGPPRAQTARDEMIPGERADVPEDIEVSGVLTTEDIIESPWLYRPLLYGP